MSSTGKLIEIERLTISLEEGRWKSIRKDNSLATYPTACPVWNGGKLVRAYLSLRKSEIARLGGQRQIFRQTAQRENLLRRVLEFE